MSEVTTYERMSISLSPVGLKAVTSINKQEGDRPIQLIGARQTYFLSDDKWTNVNKMKAPANIFIKEPLHIDDLLGIKRVLQHISTGSVWLQKKSSNSQKLDIYSVGFKDTLTALFMDFTGFDVEFDGDHSRFNKQFKGMFSDIMQGWLDGIYSYDMVNPPAIKGERTDAFRL